jgi:hypothetical protein
MLYKNIIIKLILIILIRIVITNLVILKKVIKCNYKIIILIRSITNLV